MSAAHDAHCAIVEGFARGLHGALRTERPDLAWEVDVRPLDREAFEEMEACSEVVADD